MITTMFLYKLEMIFGNEFRVKRDIYSFNPNLRNFNKPSQNK